MLAIYFPCFENAYMYYKMRICCYLEYLLRGARSLWRGTVLLNVLAYIDTNPEPSTRKIALHVALTKNTVYCILMTYYIFRLCLWCRCVNKTIIFYLVRNDGWSYILVTPVKQTYHNTYYWSETSLVASSWWWLRNKLKFINGQCIFGKQKNMWSQ